MKKILISCVSYNSYDKMQSFIDSLVKSFNDLPKNLQSDMCVDIYAIDNSDLKKKFVLTKSDVSENFNVKQCICDNFGYFPTAFKFVNETLNLSSYNFVIISNVDLVVEQSFFLQLYKASFDETVGWIAPSIWSKYEGRDKNPQRYNRPSKQKICLLRLMYFIPMLQRFYTKHVYSKRKVMVKCNNACKIYSGHGSFIILTKVFVNFYKKIEYPCFLYCEELFLGELIKNAGLSVLYYPLLKIIDDEHVSTAKLPGKSYYKYNRQSLKYIFETFYKRRG